VIGGIGKLVYDSAMSMVFDHDMENVAIFDRKEWIST
jgi:hypothetical protein